MVRLFLPPCLIPERGVCFTCVRCATWWMTRETKSLVPKHPGCWCVSPEWLWRVVVGRAWDQLAISERVSVTLDCWVGSNPVLASKMVSAEIYLSRCFEQQQGRISVLSVTEPGVPTEEAGDPAVMVSSSGGVFPGAPWECPGHQPLTWGPQGWCPSSLELRRGAASDGGPAGPVGATFSRVWVQERRGPVGRGWSPAAGAHHLPGKTGKLQQRRRLSTPSWVGREVTLLHEEPTALAFRACIWMYFFVLDLNFIFVETVQYSALQVKSV